MPESLSDRQFETMRRVQPGRRVPNRQKPGDVSTSVADHWEEYATAVVGINGEPVMQSTADILTSLLEQQRLTNRYLHLLCTDHGFGELEGDLSDLN